MSAVTIRSLRLKAAQRLAAAASVMHLWTTLLCIFTPNIAGANVKPTAHLAAELAPVDEHARCRHVQLFQPQCGGQGQRQRHVEVGLKDL